MTTFKQLSFSGGEIAPELQSRIDTQKYQTGARTLRNWYVMRHGGATNRPGTSFIGETKDSSKTARLIPFFFNNDQTYILEFGDEYLRVIRNQAYVSDLTLTITNITQANPAVLTYTGTDPANGDEFFISGVVGMTQVNSRNFKVVNVNTGANTFELDYLDGTNVNSTSFTAYSSGGTADRIYTIVSPYDHLDLPSLQFVQSADVITIAHPSYAPRTLSRSGHASWSFSTISFAPSISPPTGLGTSGGGAPTNSTSWVVTSVDGETGEESLASSSTSTTATVAVATPVTVSWSAAAGASSYNVYQALNGVYGFIGNAVGTSFVAIGLTPDTTDTPPVARNPFGSTDNYPSCVNYIQQRLVFAATNNDPEKIWASRSGLFYNFTVSSPLQDDDAITINLVGAQVNRVRHLVDISTMVALTESGEWAIPGNSAGVITPTEANPKQHGYNGANNLSPIVVGSIGLYVQSRGTKVRDLVFSFEEDGYRGQELSIYVPHLVDDYTLEAWAFQQNPHSIVWAVRDDGTVLGLTYVREQQIIAWHRHDFGGEVESIATVPEGSEDAVYIIVKRTIDGATKRYVERLNTRRITDITDAIFMDSTVTYDGTNASATTMTLSGGTSWVYSEDLTLTASGSYFVSGDVGEFIVLTGSDGTVIRCEIKAYTSATVVTVRANKTVPVVMRSVAISTWGHAISQVTGLWHLEGEDVSVFADGNVIGSVNNPSYSSYTVTDGALTLEDAFVKIHIGLPITADIETLNIDSPTAETVADKQILINQVSVQTKETRGLFYGSELPDDDGISGLYEMKIEDGENYSDQVDLVTDTSTIQIESSWNNNGRVSIRQVDPLPATILSIMPTGLAPFKKAVNV